MGFFITKLGQGLASLLIIAGVFFAIFKLGEILFKGIKANNKGRRR